MELNIISWCLPAANFSGGSYVFSIKGKQAFSLYYDGLLANQALYQHPYDAMAEAST